MIEKYQPYAPSIVRYGLGIVFLLFGILQLTNISSWAQLIPEFLNQLLARNTILIFVGIFNLIIGALLMLGIYVRIASILGALHLIGVIAILFNLGSKGIAIRDIGLLLASISIFINGPDKLCIKK